MKRPSKDYSAPVNDNTFGDISDLERGSKTKTQQKKPKKGICNCCSPKKPVNQTTHSRLNGTNLVLPSNPKNIPPANQAYNPQNLPPSNQLSYPSNTFGDISERDKAEKKPKTSCCSCFPCCKKKPVDEKDKNVRFQTSKLELSQRNDTDPLLKITPPITPPSNIIPPNHHLPNTPPLNIRPPNTPPPNIRAQNTNTPNNTPSSSAPQIPHPQKIPAPGSEFINQTFLPKSKAGEVREEGGVDYRMKKPQRKRPKHICHFYPCCRCNSEDDMMAPNNDKINFPLDRFGQSPYNEDFLPPRPPAKTILSQIMTSSDSSAMNSIKEDPTIPTNQTFPQIVLKEISQNSSAKSDHDDNDRLDYAQQQVVQQQYVNQQEVYQPPTTISPRSSNGDLCSSNYFLESEDHQYPNGVFVKTDKTIHTHVYHRIDEPEKRIENRTKPEKYLENTTKQGNQPNNTQQQRNFTENTSRTEMPKSFPQFSKDGGAYMNPSHQNNRINDGRDFEVEGKGHGNMQRGHGKDCITVDMMNMFIKESTKNMENGRSHGQHFNRDCEHGDRRHNHHLQFPRCMPRCNEARNYSGNDFFRKNYTKDQNSGSYEIMENMFQSLSKLVKKNQHHSRENALKPNFDVEMFETCSGRERIVINKC